jgi:DNA replication protein DnaC
MSYQQQEEPILVNQIIFNGAIQSLTKTLITTNVRPDKYFGALTGEIQNYKCPRCHEAWGYLFKDPTGFMYFCGTPECLTDDVRSQTKEVSKQNIIEDAATKFAIGTRYKNATLSSWLASENDKRLIVNWLRSPKNILCLLGIPGTGKTFFCTAVANWLIEQKKEVFYTNIRRFFESIQKAISENKNQYEQIRLFSEKPILIIDDLGASKNTEWQKEVILDLIDTRYSSELPTVITSNYTFQEMKEIFDDRIERRINNRDNLLIIQHSSIKEEAGA